MERRSPRQRKLSSSTTPSRSTYYAGARFETTPSISCLPTPPVRWTMSSPLLRSQSTPSSPVTTNMMGTGSGDNRRPPLSPQGSMLTPVMKSASFPGDSSLMSLFRVVVPAPEFKFEVKHNHAQIQEDNVAKKPLLSSPRPPAPAKKVEEKVDLMQMLIQASPRKGGQQQKEPEGQKLESLMKSPTQASVKLSPQPLLQSCGQEIKQMDNAKNTQLKFLLKLSA